MVQEFVDLLGVALAFFFIRGLGWHSVRKKCEPVLRGNSLDEVWVCSKVIEAFKSSSLCEFMRGHLLRMVRSSVFCIALELVVRKCTPLHCSVGVL